jgi:RHS repeat-associated protein
VDGFTAAELVQIASQAGLRLQAAWLSLATELPVPSIVHLSSEHFIVVRERRGGFYGVYDQAALGPRWLTAAEVLREASGCVIVSATAPPAGAFQLTPLSPAEAGAFRGRRIGWPFDHDDGPCTTCPCPPGAGGKGGSSGSGSNGGPGNPSGASPGEEPPVSCPNCNYAEAGMPHWSVSEPFVSLWVADTPLHYDTAFGPDVTLRLSYNHRHDASVVSSQYWHGAQFGNGGGIFGLWACSWMSFAELSEDENTVDLLLPQGGWATFTFPSGSSASDVNYRHNAWLERGGSSGNYTNLILRHPDGSGATYGLRDDRSDPYGYRVYYRTEEFDASGQKTTFTYNTNFTDYFGLTNVTAADGTSFTLQLDDRYAPDYPATVTNITASYGASVSLGYVYSAPDTLMLTNITDAAGISSQISYGTAYGGAVTQLVTPYGTTTFSSDEANSLFDRSVRVTNPLGQQEFYGLIEEYSGGDWPDYAASQIPTNTVVGTLDSGERTNRNTFYWNAQQFAADAGMSLDAFNWTNFNSALIRHWLSSDDATVVYTLSVQQEPSPSNWTNVQGQLTWYDYAGKPANQNHERGTQVLPAVIARVMPDGSTAYQYFERLTNGLPSKLVEKWASGNTALYRTNTFTYAANNIDLTLHVGPDSGQVVSNYFNAYHQVLASYDALNQETAYTYDGNTRVLTSITRPTGLSTTNIYDGNNRLQKTIDLQISRTNSYTWYASGDVESHTDERGLSVTNYWDGLHRLVATKYPDNTTVSNFYTVGATKILDLTATKDRLGWWTYFGYDALRRRTAETNANGVVTRYGYCDCNGIGAVTNAWNTAVEFVTQFQYDYQGNRIYTFYPDATITNWFDSLRRPYLTADAWGSRAFYYDNLSRLTNSSNAYGTEQNTIFDIEDQPLYVTDANGVSVTNSFDALHRLLTRTYPDAGVEKFGYSARGLVAYTNQLDKITYYGYDEAMRKTWKTNANNEVLQFTYNPSDQLLTLKDGKNQQTSWNYDQYGRVTNKLDATSTESFRYKYDPNDRLTNRWTREKGDTVYRYDVVGLLTNVDYPGTVMDITLTYDGLDRLTNVVDSTGTTKFKYTDAGQLLSEDGPWASDTVSYTYSARRRASLSVLQPNASPWTQTYGYDDYNRLSTVISPAGPFGYTYWSWATLSDRVQYLGLPGNNTEHTLIESEFDELARLTATTLRKDYATIRNRHSYQMNDANQRTRQTFTDGNYVDYTYDNIGQLKTAKGWEYGGSVSRLNEQFGYQYDAAWNLQRRTNNALVQTFGVNNKNELTNATRSGTLTVAGLASEPRGGDQSWGYPPGVSNVVVSGTGLTTGNANLYADGAWARTNASLADGNNSYTATAKDTFGRTASDSVSLSLPATINFQYDGNGNLTNDGRRVFEYDYENQLTNVYVASAWKSVFQYDAFGRRRVRKEYGWQSSAWVLTNEVRYVYDGMLVVQERDANNLALVSYTRGNDLSGSRQGAGGIGGLLARTDHSAFSLQHSYFHCDGNGNVTALVDTNGFIVARYQYDPYGNLLGMSGPLAEANTYRFSSKEWHANSGLYYYGFRYYEPNLQRWLNRDPMGEVSDMNLYRVVFNAPNNSIDPVGLWTIHIWGGKGLAGGIRISGNGLNVDCAGVTVGGGVGWGAEFDPDGGNLYRPITTTSGRSFGIGLEGGAEARLLRAGGGVEASAMYRHGLGGGPNDFNLRGELGATVPIGGLGVEGEAGITDGFGAWTPYGKVGPSADFGIGKNYLKKWFQRIFDFGWGGYAGITVGGCGR